MSSSQIDDSLSFDYLNLLFSGQAFSDVTFSVEGRHVHAHRCILAARSLFFRKFFCATTDHHHYHHHHQQPPDPTGSTRITMGLGSPKPSGSVDGGGGVPSASSPPPLPQNVVIPVSSVNYEVFILLLQFLYSGRVSVVPPKHEPRSNCGERGCWHTHCSSAVDLALDILAAARSFDVDQLAMIAQKELASMVEKASIEDVMKVLIASRKQEMHQLWSICSHLVAKSGLPPEVLAKHIPIDAVAKIEELRLKSSLARRSLISMHHRSMHHHHHHHHHDLVASTAAAAAELKDHHIQRMRRALDSSDVELVKLMVMGEGLNLDEALALHYAVQNCTREVVKALLELGAADVNYPAGPIGKTPLHLAAEMVSPDMVAVLLDHHADPNVRTMDGITSLDILRTLTSDFLFKGAVPGLTHIEPNKLRLCLELVQSAALVISREEGNAVQQQASAAANNIFPPLVGSISDQDHNSSTTSSSGGGGGGNGNLGNNMNVHIDSRLVYLHLGGAGAPAAQMGDDDGGGVRQRSHGNTSMYHHSHHEF
ncbi:Regulatory protein npr5 [Dionaea muscipula]